MLLIDRYDLSDYFTLARERNGIMGVKKRRCCILFFSLVAVCLAAAARPAAAKAQQGKCGPKAKWSYNKKTSTVTISGKGAVTKMIRVKAKVSKVKTLIIREGIINLKNLSICIEDQSSHKVNDAYKIRVILPDSLKKIGWIGSVTEKGVKTKEFDMSNLTLTIPKNVNKINSAAMANIKLGKVIVDKGNKFFIERNGVLYSKDKKTLIYYPIGKRQKTYKLLASVRKIAPLAFYGNRHIKTVVLPKKLKEMGSGAFCGCTKLSSINLEQTKIKKLTDYENFFDGTERRTELEYLLIDTSDDSVLKEDEYPAKNSLNSNRCCGTFERTNLTSIILPDSLVYASSDTFLPNYGYLADSKRSPITLHLGKNFTGEINKDTKGYQGARSLCLSGMPVASVTVDRENTRYCVKNKALYSKDGKTLYQHFVSDDRKNYVIDAGTKQIAPGAFSWGDNIVNLVVEGSLDSVGYCAFSYYQNYPDKDYYGNHKVALESVSVQGSIDRIDAMAFSDCGRLVTFECAGEIHYICQRAFYGCSSLTSIPLDRGLKIVGGYAFSMCRKLQVSSLSNSLVSIGTVAFGNCEAIKELYIPDSVDRIWEGAFSGCSGLETINIPVKTMTLNSTDFFQGCYSLKNIICR